MADQDRQSALNDVELRTSAEATFWRGETEHVFRSGDDTEEAWTLQAAGVHHRAHCSPRRPLHGGANRRPHQSNGDADWRRGVNDVPD